MESEADKLRHDLERYCYLLTQITDDEGVKYLLELIGEATLRLKEVEAIKESHEE